MGKRLETWWFDWQQSLWFLPAAITVGAVALALGMVRLDQALALSPQGHYTWVFGGGASGARGVLEAIAGSIVTVTGTVFSITIVTLQLASSQFSSRVLRTFTSDRGVQLVLGVFVGTFTYCLLVLRSVRSEADAGYTFVPSVSVTLGVGLSLVSVGFLIYYIHHVARSIQVDSVADRITNDTGGLIDRFWTGGSDGGDSDDDTGNPTVLPAADPATVTAAGSGYLQRIALDALFGVDSDGAMLVRIEPCVGDFVLAGTVIASIWPPAANSDEVRAAVRAACQLGRERTPAEDVDFGIQQLAAIAIKALSPGINDPTTATICIDRLSELLGRVVGGKQPRATHRRDNSRLIVSTSPASVERLVDTAVSQVRHYGAGDPVVTAHLLTTLGNLARLASPTHRPVIVAQAGSALTAARHRFQLGADRERVEAAAAWLADVAVTG
jgi:uncharacterized membrane protein